MRAYSIWDFYTTDLTKHMTVASSDRPLLTEVVGEQQFQIEVRGVLDFPTNSKFLVYKLPSDYNLRGSAALIDRGEEFLTAAISGVECFSGEDRVHPKRLTELVYSRQIFLYIDASVPVELKEAVYTYGHDRGLYVEVRDQEYAARKAAKLHTYGFICHAWEDKERIAKPLASALYTRMTPVWFDEFSLKVGDSLRASVDKGVHTSPQCLLIISKAFLENTRYARHEFESFFTKEKMSGRRIFIPVWVDVTAEDVYNYSPFLKDRVAAIWSDDGLERLADQLARRLQEEFQRHLKWAVTKDDSRWLLRRNLARSLAGN